MTFRGCWSADEAEQRRYLGLGALKNARAVLTARATDELEEVSNDLIAAAITA